MPVYIVGIFLIAFVTNLLSKRIKNIQKTIVVETTSLAGSTTESLRNIEIVKSLGLTNPQLLKATRRWQSYALETKKNKNPVLGTFFIIFEKK
jgi:ATP-binding cassette subfamily B protein